jgi:chemotaxis protein MotB
MNLLKIMTKNIFILIIILLTSCVSSKQFKELQDRNMTSESQRDSLLVENEKLKVKNNEFISKIGVYENDLSELEKDSLNKSIEIKRLKKQINSLNSQYKDLEYSLESLRQGSAEETKRLLRQLQSTQEDLQKREDRLNKLELDLTSKQSDLASMQQELNSSSVRLQELERILNQKDSATNALREKVTNALLGFQNEGLKVTMKNGKVYVSLDERLLFPSGSTQVNARGVSALKKLAEVLAQNTDINVMIEGHTDDVPIRSGSTYKDNWDLSVMRATAIVRILLDGSSIDPQRLIPSGRGEFMPLVENSSSETRQQNRRTEIILTPKLDELLQILETN